MRKILALVCAVLSIVYLAVGAESKSTKVTGGEWGAHAVNLDGRSANKLIMQIPSPDRNKVLVVTETDVLVKRLTGESIGRKIEINTLAEIEWAPDSRAFAVTQSDGGAVGTWYVEVYRILSGSLQKIEVMRTVSADFQTRPGGCTEEVANIGAVGWLGPKSLLMVAEAPPHSSCRDMSVIRGYEVSVSDGCIIRRYKSNELKKRHWKLLGPRLKGDPQ
jgi:hypothetical protein